MILLRVQIEGFMCYREPQVLFFDGAPLWVLAGPNGAGKSTVFDAVTFAFFGKVRDAENYGTALINHGADRLAVEVDFAIDGRTYRVRRTRRRRGASTFAALRIEGVDAAGKDLVGHEPDADTERGLNAWVVATIGLDHDAFTSTVLLRQGQADRLLNVKPAKRFEILRELVALSAYRRLHDAVDAQRKQREHEERFWRDQLGGIPEVTEEAIAAAQEATSAAQATVASAREAVEGLTRLAEQARRWEAVQVRLAKIAEDKEHDRQLLDDAAEIERGRERHADLDRVLPDLQVFVVERDRLVALGDEAARHEATIADLEPRWEAAERDARGAEQEAAEGEDALLQAQMEIGHVDRALAAIAPLVAKLDELERVEAEASEAKAALNRLPQNLDDRLAAAKEHDAHLARIEHGLPWLQALAGAREELVRGLATEQAEIRFLATVDGRIEVLAEEMAGAVTSLDESKEHEQCARDELSRTEALHTEARQRRRRFEETTGQRVCSACGQEINEEHAADERRRLDDEITKSVGTRDAARGRLVAATKARQAAEAAHEELTTSQVSLTEQRRDHAAALDAVRQAIARADNQAVGAFRHLPPPLRARVAVAPPVEPKGWTLTVFPTQGDLDRMQAEVDDGDAHRQLLTRLQGQTVERAGLQTLIDSSRKRVAAIEREHDRAGLDEARCHRDERERERSRLAARLAELQASVEELAGTARKRRTAADDLHAILEENRRDRTKLLERCDEVDRRRIQAFERLPQPWNERAAAATATDLDGWQTELRSLAEFPELWEALVRARERFDGWDRQERDARAEVEGLPSEARRPAATVDAELAQAQQIRNAADEAFRARSREVIDLEQRQAQRISLERRRADADRQRHLHQVLATQLGRSGVQMYLLRQAETAIVAYANETLDRLSGGRMRLRLNDEAAAQSDKALDLTVHDHATGADGIAIGLASGSQRFRIAVSLALAIGRYLGQASERVQSVIIDEGFGSLDKVGRIEMIEELTNLQSQLSRIVLVSHQEEIAEAFPNRYAVALDGGVSRVTLSHDN